MLLGVLLTNLYIGLDGPVDFTDVLVGPADKVSGEGCFRGLRPVVNHGLVAVPNGSVDLSLADEAVAPHDLRIGCSGTALVESDEFFKLSHGCLEVSLGKKALGNDELILLDLSKVLDHVKPQLLMAVATEALVDLCLGLADGLG